MLKNNTPPATEVDYVKAPYDVEAGECVLVDEKFGVATHDAKKGEVVGISTAGEFKVAKLVVEFWRKGDQLYWDRLYQRLTATQIGSPVAIAASDTRKTMQNLGVVRLIGVAAKSEEI